MSDYGSLYKSAWRKKAAKRDAKKSMSRAKALAKWRARPTGPLTYVSHKEESELKICEQMVIEDTIVKLPLLPPMGQFPRPTLPAYVDGYIDPRCFGVPVNSFWYRNALTNGDNMGGFTNTTLAGANPGLITKYLLNGIGCGPGVCQRVGRRIEMQTLHLRIGVELRDCSAVGSEVIRRDPETGEYVAISIPAPRPHWRKTPSSNFAPFARFVVVYDRQSNGETPNVQTVFAEQAYGLVDNTTSAIGNPLAGINVQYKDRFAILADKIATLPAINSFISLQPPALNVVDESSGANWANSSINFVGEPNSSNMVDVFVPLNGLETVYKTDPLQVEEARASDIATGALWFFAFTNLDRQDVSVIGSAELPDDQQPWSAYIFHNTRFRLVYTDK